MIITEYWEEEALRGIIGDEEIASFKCINDFDENSSNLEITVKIVPK